ncbi:GFA family protein [Albidovulum sp.]
MSLPALDRPHRARCHCGAVELAVTLVPEGFASARRCDCSFCARRGAIAVSAPLDGVRVVKGQDVLTLYTWNTHTAQHWFCSICGIFTHHRRRSNPNEYGVNVACLEGVNPRDLGDVRWTDGVNHPCDRDRRGS